MDNFNIPKKVNRHVLKAINSLSEEMNKRYTSQDEIVMRVKYQIKNLVPVRGIDDVIKQVLYNLCQLGLLISNNGEFGIRRVLDELQVPKSSPVISKRIKNSNRRGRGTEEQACCSNRIGLNHTTNLAQHPSVTTVPRGSETLQQNRTSQPDSTIKTTQQPFVVASSSNFSSGSNTIGGQRYLPPFTSTNSPFRSHLLLARRQTRNTRSIFTQRLDSDLIFRQATMASHEEEHPISENPVNDITESNQNITDTKIVPRDHNERQD